jgi:trehalose-phosphatase
MREFTRGLRTPILPIYVGDDLTDEPAFVALRRGITVRVGNFSRTKARFRLRDPEEVCTFLKRMEEEVS